MKTISNNPITAGILGVIVGDALGLPVQFQERSQRDIRPITDMIGYGSFNLPPGSWSDDSSLTLCLVDALNKVSINNRKQFLNQVAQNFCNWLDRGYWTPFDEAYDVGGTTAKAVISLLQEGKSPLESGKEGEYDNGNGSLMRILPLAFYHKKMSFNELIELTHQVGSITHAHYRSNIACGIYITMAVELLKGKSPSQAYENAIFEAKRLYRYKPDYSIEFDYFKRILNGNIDKYERDDISSSTYVVSSLEAAFWCFLTTTNYSDAVLKAINLGDDTDSVAAITGGLAGIYYGLESIPKHWLNRIQKIDEIIDLINLFAQKVTPLHTQKKSLIS